MPINSKFIRAVVIFILIIAAVTSVAIIKQSVFLMVSAEAFLQCGR